MTKMLLTNIFLQSWLPSFFHFFYFSLNLILPIFYSAIYFTLLNQTHLPPFFFINVKEKKKSSMKNTSITKIAKRIKELVNNVKLFSLIHIYSLIILNYNINFIFNICGNIKASIDRKLQVRHINLFLFTLCMEYEVLPT